jgi:hypothetical protein
MKGDRPTNSNKNIEQHRQKPIKIWGKMLINGLTARASPDGNGVCYTTSSLCHCSAFKRLLMPPQLLCSLSTSINAYLFSAMQKLARLLTLNGLPLQLEAGKLLCRLWVLDVEQKSGQSNHLGQASIPTDSRV